MLEGQQRKVRGKLVNYDNDSEDVAEVDMEPSESDVVTAEDTPKKRVRRRKDEATAEDTPKKRGRSQKVAATKTKVKRKVEVEEDAEEDMEEDVEEDAEEDADRRFMTEIEKQAGGDKKKMRELLTKHFVPLIDILPPLPIKGDFDIELIKQSPYFFS